MGVGNAPTCVHGIEAKYCVYCAPPVPDGRGYGPIAEMNELRQRIERLERIVSGITGVQMIPIAQ